MKNIIFSLIVLFSSSIVLSQTIYSGKVVDIKNETIAFANVVIYKANDKSIEKGDITDEDGNFKIEINAKESHYLEISFLGFKTKRLDLTENNLGKITLEEDVNSLKEVVVKGKKQNLIRKNDRLIFNIENTIVQELGSAVDVLRVTPNIVMRDDKLTMLGKNFVRVMVNGKMMPFQGDDLRNYLATINSNDIKSIEVITVPPSEFEAEGNGGVINIILKQQKNDFWSVNLGLTSAQRKEFSYGRNGSFNYKKKNTYLTMSVSNGKFLKNNIFNNNYFYENETWDGHGLNRYDNDYLNYRFSLTQNITKRWEAGVSYSGSNSDTDNRTNNLDKVYDLSNNLKYSINSDGLIESDSRIHSLNLYNQVTLDSLGKNVSFDLDYYKALSYKTGYNSGEKTENSLTNPLFSNNNTIDYNFQNFSNKIDVSLPFKEIEFKLGTKVSLSETNNDFKFYDSFTGSPILDENQSNVFNYKENIFAAYFTGSKNLTDKISVKAGLRAEKTVTTAFSKAYNQLNKNDYTKWFPTLYVSYSLENNKSISLSFNRRLNRPYFESLDPFKIVLNPFKTVQGNPFLKPSYITSSELIYNASKNELKVYAQRLEDEFEQIGEVDPNTRVINYTFYNYINVSTLGVTDTYIFDKLSWLTSYNTIDVGYSRMSSSLPQTIQSQDGLNALVQTQNNIKLTSDNNFLLGINYYYVFPTKINLSSATGYGPLDISLRLKLLEGNLNLSLHASDILNTSRSRVTNFFNGVRTTYKNYYDSRYVSFGVRYTFGNTKIGSKTNRSGNDDIQNRSVK